VGWSRRHLSQRFTDEYGIGPKQTARLVRFQRARDLVAAGTRPLAEVAVDCGYADQAHLTREFCELAGDPPTTWRREERPFIQDLADDA
jgi:transcriptional regulator GlxA family with amidase domain